MCTVWTVLRITADVKSCHCRRPNRGDDRCRPGLRTRRRQPWLHDLEIAAHGNLTCVADRSRRPGLPRHRPVRRRPPGADPLVAHGRRRAPVRVSAHSSGATTRVLSVARNLGDEGPDPTIEVHRDRLLVDGGLREELAIASRWRPTGALPAPARGGRRRRRAAQREGRAGARRASSSSPPKATPSPGATPATRPGSSCPEPTPRSPTTASAPSSGDADAAARRPHLLGRRGDGHPHRRHRLRRHARRRTSSTGATSAPGPPTGGSTSSWSTPSPTSPSWCWPTPTRPTDPFAAAGTPWYLTLFGRDSSGRPG